MKIKVSKPSCCSASQKRTFRKLARYVTSHYPKDAALHKCVQGCFSAFEDASAKLKKSAKPKRRSIKRRSAPKRRMSRRHARRRTARRAAPKRWGARRTTHRRSARRARRMR